MTFEEFFNAKAEPIIKDPSVLEDMCFAETCTDEKTTNYVAELVDAIYEMRDVDTIKAMMVFIEYLYEEYKIKPIDCEILGQIFFVGLHKQMETVVKSTIQQITERISDMDDSMVPYGIPTPKKVIDMSNFKQMSQRILDYRRQKHFIEKYLDIHATLIYSEGGIYSTEIELFRKDKQTLTSVNYKTHTNSEMSEDSFIFMYNAVSHVVNDMCKETGTLDKLFDLMQKYRGESPTSMNGDAMQKDCNKIIREFIATIGEDVVRDRCIRSIDRTKEES